jgi:TorA maturation chaperone TorD
MIARQDIQMERARAKIYGFFSALLLNPPTAEMLAGVLGETGISAWEAIFPSHPACERLKELAEGYGRGEWQAEDFLLDYEALFRVPGHGYVHPFESVYRQECFSAGQVKGCAVLAEPAREVASIYREHGLAPSEGFTELPDHLGVELELMSVLCRKTAEALEDEGSQNAARLVTQQRSFLAHHLLTWGPNCLDKIREKGGTPLYVSLSDLLQAFFEEESDSNRSLTKAAGD